MGHRVISECVDSRTGIRYFPGDSFPEAEDAHITRLMAAGVLSGETSSARSSRGAGIAQAEAELEEISRTLNAARKRRDDELVAISDEIAKARAAADIALREIADTTAKAQAAAVDAAAQESVARDPADDGLADKTIPELREIATAEGVDLGGATKADRIVAAIRAKRAPAS